VSETNLSSYGSPLQVKGGGCVDLSPTYNDFDINGGGAPVTLNNVLIMENIEPTPATVTGTFTATKTFVNLDTKSWHGGCSTIVTPSAETPVFAEIQTNMVPRRSGGGGRRIKEEELSPEEEEKLRQRRERNKQAAARCRKRRVDQTTALQNEVDVWEEKKRVLQEEINALMSERDELQFILDAHKNVCSLPTNSNSSNHRSRLVTGPLQQQAAPPPKVIVKSEEQNASTTFQHHLTHEEALDLPSVVSSCTTSTPASLFTSSSLSSRPARPASLSLSIKPQNLRSIEGIPIETPTNVFSSLNFDALMEGRTGLTPTNVLTPVSVSMSATALQTPVVGGTPNNCGSQQRNNDILSPDAKPKLVSL